MAVFRAYSERNHSGNLAMAGASCPLEMMAGAFGAPKVGAVVDIADPSPSGSCLFPDETRDLLGGLAISKRPGIHRPLPATGDDSIYKGTGKPMRSPSGLPKSGPLVILA